MEITGAAVHISQSGDYFPGTNDRVVYITGTEPQVTLAQALVWELIGQQTANMKSGEDPVNWDPIQANNNPGQHDDEMVEAKISIPSSAGGLIVGKSGSTIRNIAHSCGSDMEITNKEEGISKMYPL